MKEKYFEPTKVKTGASGGAFENNRMQGFNPLAAEFYAKLNGRYTAGMLRSLKDHQDSAKLDNTWHIAINSLHDRGVEYLLSPKTARMIPWPEFIAVIMPLKKAFEERTLTGVEMNFFIWLLKDVRRKKRYKDTYRLSAQFWKKMRVAAKRLQEK